MGVTVITTPYGRGALERLAEAVAVAKGDDLMRQVVVIAPGNLAGIVARRHLARGIAGQAGVAGLEITTLPRLAERLAAHTLAPRRPATRPLLAAAWRAALREAPGAFSEVADHPATVSALAAAYDELREVGERGLSTLGGATVLSADLVRLHADVRGRVTDRWYDPVDLLAAATGVVREKGQPGGDGQASGGQGSGARGSGGPVILYLPQLLTPSERAFVAALAEATEVTVIMGETGARRADAGLRDSLRSLVAGLPDERRVVATADRVLNASDSDDEVRCVVREVLAALETTPATRIAVLYAATSPYARLLHEHLAAAGIRINGPGVRAVHERAVARTLLELLRLADSDVARADLFRALAGAPARDFAGERLPLARWERVSRAAGVVRGDDWASRLSAYADDEERRASETEAATSANAADETWRAQRHRDNAQTARDLQAFSVRLRDALARAGTMTRWNALASWCLELFATVIGDPDQLRTLPAEEQYAAATVVSTLRGLASLDDLDAAASLTALRDGLESELAGALPRVGRYGEGVLVAPLSAAVGLDLDLALVVGLSEDLCPGGQREDALLPAHVRELVPEALLSSRERLHTRYRQVLAAFAAARTVVASFPRGDLRRSTHRLPSRWLLASLRALSGDEGLAATRWDEASYPAALATSGSFAGELLTTARAATEQEWRVRAASAGALDDVTVDEAARMMQGRAHAAFTRYDGNLSGVAGLPDYARAQEAVSPTSLESYAVCPRAYFQSRLLGVRPIEQPEDTYAMSPADIGTLVHECLDRLVHEHADALPGPGEPWSTAHRVRLREIADECMQRAEERGLTGHPRLWHPERLRILDDLEWMLDDDDAWRAAHDARVVASELSFGLSRPGSGPAVEIVIPSGRLLMRGSADKVDAADGRLIVTDLKTGKRRTFSEISTGDQLAGGTKLQLPVYAYAARAAFGDETTSVTAGYWFVRQERGRIDLALTPELEERYAKTLDVLVRSIAGGLFPGKAPEGPDYGTWSQCPHCNPDGLGHGDERDRWERYRHDPVLDELVGLIEPSALDGDGDGDGEPDAGGGIS